VLNGGFRKWQEEQRPVTAEVGSNETRDFRVNLNSDMCVTTADIERNLEASEFMLIDARDEKRFKGEQEPLDPVAGHVPGAVNYPFFRNLNEQGSFLDTGELEARYAELFGNNDPEKVVCMCGSGVTACHNLLAMEHIGLKGARLYPGSWSAWVSDRNHPVASGDE
jgi:thiosulfate/3-mercaptopyruvate sulfurtransferase